MTSSSRPSLAPIPPVPNPPQQQQQQIIHNSYKYMCTLEVKIIANLTSEGERERKRQEKGAVFALVREIFNYYELDNN